MDGAVYSNRPNAFAAEQTVQLAGDELVWTGGREGRVALADIVQVRQFATPGLRFRGGELAPAFSTCVLKMRDGSRHVLQGNHYRGVGDIEDRSAALSSLTELLLPRIARANPSAVFLAGMSPGLWMLWVGVLAISVAAAALGAAICVDGIRRGDWGDLFVGLVMMPVFGIAAWNLFRLVWRGRTRQFVPAAGSGAA